MTRMPPRRAARRPRRAALAFGAAIAALAAPAAAAPAQSLPPAAGQQALAVRADAAGLVARVCAAAPCAADGGKRLDVPADVASRLGDARVTAVTLADGKHLARIEVRSAGAGEAWVLLVAAPLAGKGAEPLVLWSGWTGVTRGEHGEERSSAVVEEPAGKGSRILVGQRRQDVTLCGRPTLVAAREVDPATMSLVRGASVQNLTAEARAKATRITAEGKKGELAVSTAPRLLRATAASSALGKRLTEIADGDPATAWSEAKQGAGRGEFVSFSAASEVGVSGLTFVIRPAAGGPDATTDPAGAAPRTLFVATTDQLFEVTFPDDPWRGGSAFYDVTFPREIKTSCLAVVLGEAYAPDARGGKDPHVTVAEVTARTALDGQGLEALVGALAGGGERAKAAAALLERGGPPAVEAAIAGYEKLDQAGRQLAAGIIDAAPCSAQVPFFVARLAEAAARAPRDELPDQPDPELRHAKDRIRRCGRAAAPALAKLVLEGGPKAPNAPAPGRRRGKPDPVRVTAAAELSLVAPAEAVTPLLDALTTANDALRRELRAALSKAARSERALSAVAAELAPERFGARPELARIDLLRALGPALARAPGGAAAFRALAGEGDAAALSFRTRYLLQAPAASLAGAGDAVAEAFLRGSLRKDADPHVRSRAAEVAARAAALAPDLLAAVGDPEVRVREAAIVALARAAAAGAKSPAGLPEALAARLASDPWTFVRSASARALGAMPAGRVGDDALAASLDDISADVRGHALDALGAHRAVAHIERVRDRAEDKDEQVEVRARAILALAAMCDATSLDLWTRLAVAAKTPLGERDHRLGSASLAALGIVHPADLRERLQPLLDKDTPRGLREMARAAIGTVGRCAKRR